MKKDNSIVPESMTIREAMKVLNSAHRILFVARDGRLLGTLTDGDVRRWILQNGSLDMQISNIMNTNPITIPMSQRNNAHEIMNKYQILGAAVVDENRIIIDIMYIFKDTLKKSKNLLNTKVVIMAGGKGERLLPYTSIVPKPLIPIGEKPIIELVMNNFQEFGCKEFYLTINYRKNMIKAYFEELQTEYNIKYIEEDNPLGTGGSLYYLKGQIHDSFFVSNCDILLDVDYSEIIRFHKASKNIMTVIASLKKYTVPYGVVNINSDGSIKSLNEKPSTDYLVNTGVYVIEPEALDYLNDNEFFHITDLISKCLEQNKRVGTYPISDDLWMDMGQFDDMEKMKAKLIK